MKRDICSPVLTLHFQYRFHMLLIYFKKLLWIFGDTLHMSVLRKTGTFTALNYFSLVVLKVLFSFLWVSAVHAIQCIICLSQPWAVIEAPYTVVL